jgi:hypothetical protein
MRAAALWLARGDNSLHVVLFATIPPLLAIVVIGFL